MSSSFGTVSLARASPRGGALAGAVSAASITIPHALALGLLAFGPLAGGANIGALALWSAALPGALMSVLAARPGVIYAPSTVVALLFGTAIVTVAGLADQLQLGPAQILAVCAATCALCFGFQWLFGAMRVASLARFLPISVMHGFAAGVGLSMVLSQVLAGFGAGAAAGWDAIARHAGVAAAVVAVALLLQRRWPRFPSLLPAVALVGVVAALALPSLRPSVAAAPFAMPATPAWDGLPWAEILRAQGVQLVLLALLTAIVNSLDIVVFSQELELDRGLRIDANAALRRESLVGVLCALLGLIPASASASRSRVVLAFAPPSLVPGRLHAAILLAVAATGHLWLHWLPLACLAGGLLLAGYNQVPRPMWSRASARSARAVWSQSWIVALVFAIAGGVGALVAGLVVATFVLLHSSASTALRRALLDGQLRSRRLRRADAEGWLAGRMDRVAVFELQGVLSFGVAAYLAEQVRRALQPRHRRVILDASRVAAWDGTALARLAALARDLANQQVELVVCGLDARASAQVAGTVVVIADLDRALEWAEEAMLQEWDRGDRPAGPDSVLGELGQGLPEQARAELERLLRPQAVPAHSQVFAHGDGDTDLAIVQAGRVTMSTAWPPERGLRLAAVGRGMAFGEMAFLSGQSRTACAGTEAGPATVLRLPRATFDAWAREHPGAALAFMSNLAQIGTRRLAATTRQLRAVLE